MNFRPHHQRPVCWWSCLPSYNAETTGSNWFSESRTSRCRKVQPFHLCNTAINQAYEVIAGHSYAMAHFLISFHYQGKRARPSAVKHSIVLSVGHYIVWHIEVLMDYGLSLRRSLATNHATARDPSTTALFTYRTHTFEMPIVDEILVFILELTPSGSHITSGIAQI
jgi:hypothetical protein